MMYLALWLEWEYDDLHVRLHSQNLHVHLYSKKKEDLHVHRLHFQREEELRIQREEDHHNQK